MRNNILYYSIKNLEEFHFSLEILDFVKTGFLKLYLNITSDLDAKIDFKQKTIKKTPFLQRFLLN